VMPKYYRITAVLHEEEWAFVRKVARLFGCSLAKALSVCVVWARQNPSFKELLRRIEEEIGSKEPKEVKENEQG